MKCQINSQKSYPTESSSAWQEPDMNPYLERPNELAAALLENIEGASK